MAKIGDLDVSGLGSRLDRLEQAVFNIERATMDLDKAFEGGMELLPDFVSRRLKGEASKKEKEKRGPPPDEPGSTRLAGDDL
jgi:hypothetical protein